jgi:hypothetical protein
VNPRRLLPTLLALAIAVAWPVVTADSAVARSGAQHAVVWNGDFETGDLSRWPFVEGDVQVVRTPTFKSRFAGRVTTTNAPDSSVGGDASFLQTGSFDLPWEMNGSDSWYRMQVYLPRGQFTPAGSSSGWDMFMEWHNDPGCASSPCKEYSPYFGIAQDGRHLVLRWVGGDSTKPTFTTVVARGLLRYNHWYDVVVHAVLSPEPKAGYVVWWVDGVRLFRRHLATLFRRPDGSVSSTQLKVGHYRSTEPTVDVNYIDGVKVGRTARSIGFKPKTRRA